MQRLLRSKTYSAKPNSNHLSQECWNLSVTNHGKNGFARWRIQDGRTKKRLRLKLNFLLQLPTELARVVEAAVRSGVTHVPDYRRDERLRPGVTRS